MLKIFCVYFDPRPIWKSDCVEPIQAGRRRTGIELPMLADDSGDTISDENKRYGEMTAWYWVWKNYLPQHKEISAIGFSHYRRFLDFTGHEGNTRRMTYGRFRRLFSRYYNEAELSSRIGDADIVMRKALPCGYASIRAQMENERPANLQDFERFAGLIKELDPQHAELVDEVLASDRLAMELQFVMKRAFFEDFVTWAFGLCRKFEERWTWGGSAEGSDARVPAFLIERFFMVWLAIQKSKGAKVLELPIIKLTGRDWRYYLMKPFFRILPQSVEERAYDYFK